MASVARPSATATRAADHDRAAAVALPTNLTQSTQANRDCGLGCPSVVEPLVWPAAAPKTFTLPQPNATNATTALLTAGGISSSPLLAGLATGSPGQRTNGCGPLAQTRCGEPALAYELTDRPTHLHRLMHRIAQHLVDGKDREPRGGNDAGDVAWLPDATERRASDYLLFEFAAHNP